MWAVFKKELKSYFLSPIGYIVIGVLLFVFSRFFYLTAVKMETVDLASLYYYTAVYGLIIVVPLLTMRMFAEERKSGTEQLILTSPVGMGGVVFGKFLAVIGITLLTTFMFFIIVSFFGKPNIITVLVAMLGFILLSSAAVSIGMFASSITENQIIAGILTIAFLVMTLFIQSDNELINNLTLMGFYQKFPSGVISLKDIVGLVSFTGMFTAFTIMVMQRRKLVK